MYSDKHKAPPPDPVRLSRISRIREHAENALYFGSNRMALIVALFNVMLFCFGAFYVGETFLSLMYLFAIPVPYTAARYAIFGFLYLFLSPLLPGLLAYAFDLYRTAQGELSGRVPVTELFCCYAAPVTLIRAWLHTAVQGILLLLPFVSTVAVLRHIPRFLAQLSLTDTAVVSAWTTVFALLAFLCTAYLTVSLSPAFFLSVTHPDLMPHRCFYSSFILMQPYTGHAVLAVIRFIVMTLLSFLLAGIPFFLYILPHAIISYVSFSKELSNSISI